MNKRVGSLKYRQDRHLPKQTQRQRKNIQIHNIRNEKGEHSTRQRGNPEHHKVLF